MGQGSFLFFYLPFQILYMIVNIRNLLFQYVQVYICLPQVSQAFVILLDGTIIAAFVYLQLQFRRPFFI